ncbi:MAG TPA: hypothetical protein VL362_01985 [Patescibacteria group bacterium]|nr:hypothetical protein [Patescibacteria group bacterium]
MDNRELLANKTLIMLISPSAMGKSTIVTTADAGDDRFGRVRGFTTRLPRDDDKPGQFFYFTEDELTTKREAGEVVTEVTYPETNLTYGTVRDSFHSEYCLLETMSNSVQTYRDLPFRRTLAVTITSPPEVWQARFKERYPIPSESAKKRLDEARLSMHWSLAQVSEHYWLINDGSPKAIAQELIDMSLGQSSGRDGRSYAEACLDITRSMW